MEKFYISHVNQYKEEVMDMKKWIKIFLFRHFLPRYAFVPWFTTTATVEGKDFIARERVLHGPIVRLTIYYFKIKVDGYLGEPEVPEEIWSRIQTGDNILVKCRKCRVHEETARDRELQSIFLTKV